jgi:hypothetical protein
MQELLAQHPRVTAEPGDDWAVRFVRGACAVAAAAEAPEGVVPK